MAKKKGKLELVWKVNTASLLKEIVNNNPTTWSLAMPCQILGCILAEVAERAIELNDDKLNALMCRLSLFEQADQYSKQHDAKTVAKVLAKVGWA